MEKKVSVLAQPVFLDTKVCKGEEREDGVQLYKETGSMLLVVKKSIS